MNTVFEIGMTLLTIATGIFITYIAAKIINLEIPFKKIALINICSQLINLIIPGFLLGVISYFVMLKMLTQATIKEIIILVFLQLIIVLVLVKLVSFI
jgi:uncharacterized membrane protein YbhN (UPF0104 family)